MAPGWLLGAGLGALVSQSNPQRNLLGCSWGAARRALGWLLGGSGSGLGALLGGPLGGFGVASRWLLDGTWIPLGRAPEALLPP